ncbi:hypothetical protein ACUYO6_000907 [Vibrio vulnificus]|uniref:hypothetical protein n=1 Tax=Vibrio vulnificus TaxID=672 RepID=UPI001A3495C2|nr:hypothetical protein [Vibrio vulnificus]HAS6279579.1 hypothetical protein [Vibrio vulnificus]HAS6302438.1 hypothetical protein [Vibrio vulnificus]HAS6312130.1 hypothetical protein [Vibrio vulnificus]HDY7561982.1 hypothetical protein [Vibrio vulnificus]
MTKLKMMPLVAMISAGLVGCGGSSGGGGGGGGPVQTVLNVSFVKAELQDIGTATSSSCKIYQRERTEVANMPNTKILIARPVTDAIDAFLSVVYSDNNGVAQGEEVFVDNGKAKIVLESIPAGGFVSIKESFGLGIYVTSFSKEFLESYKKELNNLTLTAVTAIPSSVSNCISSANLTQVAKTGISYKNGDTQGDSAVIMFYFKSELEQVASSNSEITADTGFQALSNDITLVTQYRKANSTSSLFQYGFEDWSTNNGKIEMSYTGEEQVISRPSSVDYGDTKLGIVYKNTSKVLSSVPKTESKYFYPSTLRSGEQWFAQSSAQPQANWTATLNLPIDDTWALSLDESTLFNTASLGPNPVTLSNNASGALQVDLADNITIQESENGVQRISIRPNSDETAIKLHVLYSFVNDTVIFPNISKTSASDLNSFSLQQNYWFSTEDGDLSARYIMDQFKGTAATDESIDSHGLMIDEAERTRLQAQSKTVNYITLQRNQ